MAEKTKKKRWHLWLSCAWLHSGTKRYPYFSSIVRQRKWLLLLRNVEIQKFCYHGNVTSHLSSLYCCPSCDAIFQPKQVKSKKQKTCDSTSKDFPNYTPLLGRCILIVHFLPVLPFLSQREPFGKKVFICASTSIRRKFSFDQLCAKVWQS